MEKKNFVVNAAVCDTRNVSEATLESYENISINAATIIVSKESKELIAQYNVNMNTADVTEVPADTEVSVHNGSYVVADDTALAKPTFLVVNGSLEIKKNSQKALSSFVSIVVNGALTYPSDLQEQLPPLKVNGLTDCYPADAIKLKSKLAVDIPFIIKAAAAKYYVRKKVIITDEALDIAKLVSKGASFITKKAIVAESLLEKVLPLFADETDIKTVPAGYAYIADGAKLDNVLIRKYGNKLFVDGDLIINSAGENALDKMESVRVTGNVLITEKLVDKFNSLDAEYEKMQMIKGIILEDKGILTIDKRMLTKYADGVTIIDCGIVNIKEDITPEEIEEKLQFIDCGCIFCNPEQKSAIEVISEGVGMINDSGAKGPSSMGGILKDMFDKDTRVINAASYKL